MPETLRTASYDSRPSSHLGISDYLSKHVFSIALPFLAAGAGWGLGALFKNSWFARNYYDSGIVKSFATKQLHLSEDILHATAQQNPHMKNGIIWGAKAGGLWGLYSLWRDKSQAQHSIDDVQQEVLKLKEYESPDNYLKRENQELREQISYLERVGGKAGASHSERLKAAAATPVAER